MLLTLKDNELITVVKEKEPKQNEKDEKIQWEKNNIKEMKLLIDGVKDHLVPIIIRLDSTYAMLKALEEMFEIKKL